MPTYEYVPVIKGKENDIKAVSRLTAAGASLLKPLVEIPPVHPKLTIDAHVDKFVHKVAKYLSTRPLFVDLYFSPGEKLQNGVPATIGGLRSLRKMGLAVTPTYGFDRDDTLW